jgi:hypothetical protein
MISRQESFNSRASQVLLNQITDTMFAQANRYLRMKNMYSEGDSDVLPEESKFRFERYAYEEDDFDIQSKCPKDLA